MLSTKAIAQNVAINSTGTALNTSAGLDVDFTNKGFLVPRMTAAQRAAIVTPATSLLVYQTNAGTMGIGFYFYNGAAWVPLGTNNGDWGLAGNTGTVATTNFIGTTDAIDWVIKTTGIERMRVLSGGTIAWGGSQQNYLQVDQGGSIELGGNNGVANPTASGIPYIDFHFGTGAAQDYNTRIINGATSRLDFVTASGGTVMSVNASFVGIGTTAPAYPLDVQGVLSTSISNYGYLNQGTPTGTVGGSSGINNFSIRAAGRIICPEFNATSDARIKKIIGYSNNKTDLDILNKILITDYTYIDKINSGDKIIKKLIAQQVEEVYPNAVNKSTGFIPNIYEASISIKSIENKKIIITLSKAHTFVKGDKIKLYDDKNTSIETDVLEINGENAFTVLLDKQYNKLFVYGKQVNDFRSVDYDAIAMLNVSATQELAKQIEELKAKNILTTNKLQSLEEEMMGLKAILMNSANINQIETAKK